MRQARLIAAKEFTDGVRNRWIIIVTALMTALALILTLLGTAPTGSSKIDSLAVTVVSLSSLSIFFVPLIALLLSYDCIVTERERGTLMLVLSYPVSRRAVIAGKFLGHLTLLALTIAGGYGIAGIVIALSNLDGGSHQAWGAFLSFIASSVLLGAVFLALGILISVAVRERGTAAGLAIGAWLVFVLLYDLGLIGLLASDVGQALNDGLITGLLLANPADIFRMLNLTGNSQTAALSAMTGLANSGAVSSSVLIALLAGWTILPLCAACWYFERSEQ